MASIKHSTPRVSAYSVQSRNKKLVDVPEKKVVPTKPVKEVKTKIANLDNKAPSFRKRKPDLVENVNGTAPEAQVAKKKRGRKKKVVLEEIPVVENLHSDEEQELEAEVPGNKNEKADNNENSSFKPSTSADASFSKNPIAACGNEAAEEAFRWLLNPIKPNEFFENHWEKEPFLIQRSNNNYYKGLYSSKEFEKTVMENELKYDSEIDIVAYVDGERKPLNDDERKVVSPYLWRVFKEGYSIRMRNPHTYNKALRSLCSLLQEYFSSSVGANMYLTPADTQGFPPHYDDIDAFILQIEGKKIWKLYTPSESDMLARYSSSDLSEDKIGEPIMEVELVAGDLLYFPRGYIHQAKAASDTYSLHITLSTNQLNTWGDFLIKVLSQAIDNQIDSNIEFRKSIPKDYIDYMGRIHLDRNDSEEREKFLEKAESLIQQSLENLPIDYAADEHAIDFIHGSAPPILNEKEKATSVFGNGAQLVNGKVLVPAELTLETKIRLIRRRAFRLVVDEDGARLFHTLYNGKNHKEKGVLCVEVDTENVAALSELFIAHPDYIQIKDLPNKKPQLLVACLQQLYDNGFLMTDKPLPVHE